jgi:hypothetical protein
LLPTKTLTIKVKYIQLIESVRLILIHSSFSHPAHLPFQHRHGLPRAASFLYIGRRSLLWSGNGFFVLRFPA